MFKLDEDIKEYNQEEEPENYIVIDKKGNTVLKLKETIRDEHIENPPEISKFTKAILVEKSSNLIAAFIIIAEESFLTKIRVNFKYCHEWYYGDKDDETFKAAMIGAIKDAGFVINDRENFDPNPEKVLEAIGKEIGLGETYQIKYSFNCIQEDLDYNFLLE